MRTQQAEELDLQDPSTLQALAPSMKHGSPYDTVAVANASENSSSSDDDLAFICTALLVLPAVTRMLHSAYKQPVLLGLKLLTALAKVG